MSSKPLNIGFITAFLTLVLDQASKLYLFFGFNLPAREPVTLTSFLELIVVWNRGISYGLFQQHHEWGQWLLASVALVAALVLSVWIKRAETGFLAGSLGLIVGGALGNAIDRILHGAVFDFIHFHFGSFSWYVFNIADAAIVAGVAGLLYESLVLEKKRAESAKLP